VSWATKSGPDDVVNATKEFFALINVFVNHQNGNVVIGLRTAGQTVLCATKQN
jgi:uncharacterized membrane protein YoaK (UPF0700 family)